MSAERVIEIKDVTKIYKLYDKPIDRLKESMSLRHRSYHKDFYALRGLSFFVEKGQTVDHRDERIRQVHDFKDHNRRPDAHVRGSEC